MSLTEEILLLSSHTDEEMKAKEVKVTLVQVDRVNPELETR